MSMVCKLCGNDWIENYSSYALHGVCRVCFPKDSPRNPDSKEDKINIDRLYKMVEMRYEQKMRYKEIAVKFGMSVARVGQILKPWVKLDKTDFWITKVCLRCKNNFKVPPCNISQRFCSKNCPAKGKVCKCGSTDNVSRNGKRGTYYCRKCNTERARRYYHTPNGRVAVKKALQKQYKKSPEKTKARYLLNAAVKKGLVLKPEKCEGCDLTKKLQGHHDNYDKPLEVRWLCTGCHANRHKSCPVDKSLLSIA